MYPEKDFYIPVSMDQSVECQTIPPAGGKVFNVNCIISGRNRATSYNLIS